MKFFSQLVSFVPVVVLSAVGAMAQTSDTVINGIESFVAASASLATTVDSLTVATFAISGIEIVQGLGNITTAVTSFNGEFVSTTPVYTDPEAVEVVNILTTFVIVHQELLNIIIGKHSLAAQFFLTAPIAAALRALEAVVDTFAFDLIALIPTQSGPATTQLSALNVTFTETLTTYSS